MAKAVVQKNGSDPEVISQHFGLVAVLHFMRRKDPRHAQTAGPWLTRPQRHWAQAAKPLEEKSTQPYWRRPPPSPTSEASAMTQFCEAPHVKVLAILTANNTCKHCM